MGQIRPVRRRSIAVTLGALALGMLTLIVAIPRPGASPVLATIAIGAPMGQASLSVDEAAGRAYVVAYANSGSGGSVRVLDTTRATLLHTTPLGGQPFGVTTVAVDARRGRAYAASGGATTCLSQGNGRQTCTVTGGASIVALDARTGWARRTMAGINGQALAVDERTGLLYALPAAGGAAPNGGTTPLSVIDPRTGQTVRTITLPGGGQGFGFGALAVDARAGRLVVVRMFFSGVGAPPTTVDVVTLGTGQLLRHIPLPGSRLGPSPALLIDGPRARAFVVTGAGVAVLDVRRGALLGVTPMGSGVGTLVEDERAGHVFTTTLGSMRLVTTRTPSGTVHTQVPAGWGSLRMLDARSGALLRTVPIGPATTGVAVDARRGRVYVLNVGVADAHYGLTRPGTLSVVDERSGQVVRTLTVGVVPLSLALDRRHDRLLVGCVGAFGGTPDDPWGWVPGPVRRLLPFLPRPSAPMRTPQGSVMILDTTRL